MKITLINPPIREWSKPNVVPLGLGYLASVLRDAAHEVEIMDINAYRWTREEVEQKIKSLDCDVIGIGAIVTVYKYAKWLISVLKKYHPDRKIMIGGSLGTSIPHIILEKTEADIVCIGEGERTILEIIESIKGQRRINEVKGIWYRDQNGDIKKSEPREPILNLNTLPFPAWDLFPMDIYLKNPVGAPNRNKWDDGSSGTDMVLSMNISATRGCPYKCIYCYHDFMGQGYRHRSAENIVEEIKTLNGEYGVRYIHFMDDEFCLKSDFVYAFSSLMKKTFNRRITWGCSGRVNLMTDDMIATMHDAGCVCIGYGIESGSQRILDTMKKQVTVQQAKESIRLTQKHLGWADCSFMVGTPGETAETMQETVDFCKELDLAPEVIFFTTPYPGTELYETALKEGKIKDEEDYVLNLGEQGERIRVNFTSFPDDELYDIQKKMINELGAWNKINHPEAR